MHHRTLHTQVSHKTTPYFANIDPQLLQRSMELIAMPSTHEQPAARNKALEYIADIVRTYPGITIEQFKEQGVRSFLAYAGPQRPDRFKVLLNGHVDVVPGNDSQFAPYVRDNRLYGRGSLDMKISALVLTKVFCELAPTLDYPLGLQIVTDEEPGGYNGAQYQYRQGVRTDFFITGEQSHNDIAIAAKGMCRLVITQKGVPAHSAYLWRGENAILKLTDLIAKLHALYPVPDKEAWATTVNVSKLETTSEGFINRVPHAAELHLDIRPILGDPNFDSFAHMRAFFASLDPTAEIISATLVQGHEVEPTHPMLQSLIAATERAKGKPVELLRRHGQSDICHYTADPHTRGVEFGLTGAHDHADNEYLELSSVPIMEQALRYFLPSLS
ncbi:MAG TPA: M20/M25/M40 family metallo-hydrolase [Candidatus Saccharimonadales bacterium]|nr:M20/M25/M40 family metallo-hydrolase [Candidatus Saccharimonadales bacterium]